MIAKVMTRSVKEPRFRVSSKELLFSDSMRRGVRGGRSFILNASRTPTSCKAARRRMTECFPIQPLICGPVSLSPAVRFQDGAGFAHGQHLRLADDTDDQPGFVIERQVILEPFQLRVQDDN